MSWQGPREVGVELGWRAIGGGVLKPEGQVVTRTRYEPGGHSPEVRVFFLNPAFIDNATLLLSSNSSPLVLVA